MGNITETSYFETLQEDLEHDSFIDGITMTSYETDENMICNYSGLPSVSSYESEIDLDRDIPTEDEWLESQAGVYFEGMGWRDIEGQA